MKSRTLMGNGLGVLSLVVLVMVIFSGCGAATPTPSEASALDAATEGAAPEGTVEAFYRWYTSYSGNVVVDEAYRTNEHLTADVVQKVDDIVASFTHGGYDPFLCAQDIPSAFEVGTATVDGDEATVTAHGVWNAGTEYENRNDILLKLVKLNGTWKITDVSCPR